MKHKNLNNYRSLPPSTMSSYDSELFIFILNQLETTAGGMLSNEYIVTFLLPYFSNLPNANNLSQVPIDTLIGYAGGIQNLTPPSMWTEEMCGETIFDNPAYPNGLTPACVLDSINELQEQFDLIQQGDAVYGCTNPNASNYNPNATTNDGSCLGVSDFVFSPSVVAEHYFEYAYDIFGVGYGCDYVNYESVFNFMTQYYPVGALSPYYTNPDIYGTLYEFIIQVISILNVLCPKGDNTIDGGGFQDPCPPCPSCPTTGGVISVSPIGGIKPIKPIKPRPKRMFKRRR